MASKRLRQKLEKDIQISKVEKVAIEYDNSCEFLTVTFENGNKYFFSDGEYGDIPVWRVETKKGVIK